jgi:predicted phage-related endonuclease
MLTPEQVAARAKHIGGSDAAVCCGLSSRMTARELYYIMRGEMPRPDIDPISAFIGHQMEPMLVNWVVERTGEKVHDYRRTKRSHRYPWAIGHPDRLYPGKKHGLELKTRATPEGWGPDGSEVMPDEVLIQCTHYLELFDYDAWDVAVFFLVSREFRLYHLTRDRAFGKNLMAGEAIFMQRVEAGEPPEWDFDHGTTLELMKQVYPGTDGKQIDLPPEALDWWNVMDDARKQRARYDAVIQGCKNHVLSLMGTAALGYCVDGETINQKRTANGALILNKRKFVNYQ